MLQAPAKFNLWSPTGLIRMMVQKSGCFRVVERGLATRNLMQERELASGGQLQTASNVGGGQLRAADYVLTPAVLFSEGNAGGVGGAIGGLLGRRAPVLGAVAGGLKFKEAQTILTVVDVRTSEQVAAAEGKARKKDFALGVLAFAVGAVGGVGGYTNTNEGKVIAEGDVVLPKIAGVKLYAGPAESARVAATLTREDELVASGEEKAGFVKVQGGAAEGWVKKALVRKQAQ